MSQMTRLFPVVLVFFATQEGPARRAEQLVRQLASEAIEEREATIRDSIPPWTKAIPKIVPLLDSEQPHSVRANGFRVLEALRVKEAIP